MSKQTFRYCTQKHLNRIRCLCSQEVGFEAVTLKAIYKNPCFLHVEILDTVFIPFFFMCQVVEISTTHDLQESVQQMQTFKMLK